MSASTTPTRSTRSRRSRGSRRWGAPMARSTIRCSRTGSPGCGIKIVAQAALFSHAVSLIVNGRELGAGGLDPQAGRLGEPAGRRSPICWSEIASTARTGGPAADRAGRRRRHPDFPAIAACDHLQRIERNPAQHPRQARPKSSELEAWSPHMELILSDQQRLLRESAEKLFGISAGPSGRARCAAAKPVTIPRACAKWAPPAGSACWCRSNTTGWGWARMSWR